MIYQIESYTGEKRGLDSRIDFSAVNINLQEVVKTSELKDTPRTLGDEISRAFSDSVDSVADFGKSLLIFFVGRAPIILLWLVVLGLAAIIIIRILKKGRLRGQAGYRGEEEKATPPSGDASKQEDKNE